MVELTARSVNFAARTRAQRRNSLDSIIRQLTMIRDAEIACLEKRPSNFHFSYDHHVGEAATEAIDLAVDHLARAYKDSSGVADQMRLGAMPF